MKNPVIEKARHLTDSVIVGVSGGKDSVVTLDLCRSGFRKVSAFFAYAVKGLSFQEQYLKYLESRYGIEIIRVPHWDLSLFFRYADYADMTKIRMECPVVKQKDIEVFLTGQTGIEWFAYGERITDSIMRRAMIKKCQGVDEKNKRVYPAAFYSKEHIIKYLKLRKIPLAPEYRWLGRSFANLRPEHLVYVKSHHPEDFEKIKEVFPYVETAVKREEFRNKQIPEVSTPDDTP